MAMITDAPPPKGVEPGAEADGLAFAREVLRVEADTLDLVSGRLVCEQPHDQKHSQRQRQKDHAIAPFHEHVFISARRNGSLPIYAPGPDRQVGRSARGHRVQG